MTDFWIDILLATLVTISIVVADSIANSFISYKRRLIKIDEIRDSGNQADVIIKEIQKEMDIYRATNSEVIVWGSQLAAIAFALDISILGVWISSPEFFPFFTKWNSADISRELPIWIILIFTHFFILMISIVFKHNHYDRIGSARMEEKIEKFSFIKVKQNLYKTASDLVGFLSFLSSLIVITNAL